DRARARGRARRVPQRPGLVHRLLPARGHRVSAAIERLDDVRMDEVVLTTPVREADLARLKLGDVVYLDGTVYTAREGVYRKLRDGGRGPPAPGAAPPTPTFLCPPAASARPKGTYAVEAVTPPASFRFGK